MIEIFICFNLLPSGNIEAVAQRCFVKKVLLDLCQSLFFNEVAGLWRLNAAILCILLLIV